MADTPDFPQPEPDDPEDVRWNLQTADTMWSRGDTREALRWLRRAAEAAGASGDDLRAVTLARAAADLASVRNIPASIPPEAAVPSHEHEEDAATPVRLASRVTNERVSDEFPENEHTIPERPAVEKKHTEPPARSPSIAPGGVALRPRQALHVAVQPSPEDRGLLLVRPLAEGEPAPDGCHEALLVALEAGVHLLSKRR